MIKYMIIWFIGLVLTLSVTLATWEDEETKCENGKAGNDKTISCKCDIDENNKSKNIPKKDSPKCGQGKCGG